MILGGHRTLTEALASLPGRCVHGYAACQPCPTCTPVAPVSDKEAAFTLFHAALLEAVRPDRTVHACDVRPLTQGRIESRLLSSCWSKARRDGLLIEAGHERSDDVAGRNSHRMEAYYELRAA